MNMEDNKIQQIRSAAHAVHEAVNQRYDCKYPYGFHLDMVADGVSRFAPALPVAADDFVAVMFGAYFHDSIEDARLTYNDVVTTARQFMPADKAVMAAEIVYALTNEKGRTRAERADSRYYAGIRRTPYAPLVKLADRLANMSYSCTHLKNGNKDMAAIYRDELPHFLEAIAGDGSDPRCSLPAPMVEAVKALC